MTGEDTLEKSAEPTEFESQAEIVGKVPNIKALTENPLLTDLSLDFHATFAEGLLSRDEIPEEARGALQEAINPSLDLMSRHFKSTMGLEEAIPLSAWVSYDSGVLCAPESELDQKTTAPHTDMNLNFTKPFYVVAVGVPTKVYRGEVKTDPMYPPHSEHQIGVFRGQIDNGQLDLMPVESGDILAFNGRTLHARPTNPESIGTQRTFIRVVFSAA